ncbi:uncharacterized protein LACBIDRAFT_307384 [Laccaria bicolor S238N-H82]|uniref:Predicted protein n=1 Tax=Laccaria bicolor (strain S238N-H82 / ATCC MYA-4686) TaxID=486041 RepID=B0DQ07_LACBS|nr:uncharacterized protein LACBIDRAFT_307384 [Laccaria bicolor S238N-H82]EDR03302.1 predicted protein [Laccaria bicolor S238N-H82]|eukprot:XP_001886098.1 predicted protein [Laccaria bicolor S238N-H82]
MFHPFVDGVYVQDGKEKESNTITRSPITVSYLSPQRPTLELNSIPIASSGESSVIPTDTNIPTLASQANLPHQTRARQSLASLLSLLLSNCFHNKSLASLLSQQISGILAFTTNLWHPCFHNNIPCRSCYPTQHTSYPFLFSAMDVDEFLSDQTDEHQEELDFAQKRSYAEEVYRGVYTEFFAWEQEECRRTLISLRTTTPKILRLPRVSTSYHPSQVTIVEGSEKFYFDDLVDDSNSFQASCLTIKAAKWSPCPRYFSCTPISQNTQRDTVQDCTLPFVPYADDPNFPVFDYLENFSEFAWQEEFKDPDMEEIQSEAVRRLIFGPHKFTLQDVDDLGFFSLTRVTNSFGLLWDTTQRPSPNNMDHRYPRYILSYFKRHKYFLSQSQLLAHILFCAWWSKFAYPRYKQLIFFIYILFLAGKADVPYVICDEASGAYQLATIEPAKAAETNESLKLSEVEPCGALCFKLQDFDSEENYLLESSPWSNPDDITMLEGILKLTPNTIPCDLAIICRKPCFEVFIYRSRLLPDEKILETISYNFSPSPSEIILPEFVNMSVPDESESKLKISLLSPCQHKGPCHEASDCHCYKEAHHCSRNCRCSLDCPIRWKGCKCGTRKKSSGHCGTEKCPCWAAARECDPELCVKCDARGRHKKKKCLNNDIQKGRFQVLLLDQIRSYMRFLFHKLQPIKIAKGLYGSGAYAQCALPKGVFIGGMKLFCAFVIQTS